MKILASFLLFLLLNNTCFSQWLNHFGTAKKVASASNKMILIDFWASWCGPCVRMDSDTWSDSEVQSLMTLYVPVKIDVDINKQLASQYNIRSIPDVFILDPNGMVVHESKGYKNKTQMMSLLKKYALNTAKNQSAIIDYATKKSGDNALQVAEGYMNMSIFLNKDLKNIFLNLSDKYISNAKNLYKKEHQKNKNKQRISLLYIYRQMIKGKFEKAKSKLDKDFKETNILPENKELFDYLNFIFYSKLKDNENAKIWYDKLKSHPNYKVLIARSRKIIL